MSHDQVHNNLKQILLVKIKRVVLKEITSVYYLQNLFLTEHLWTTICILCSHASLSSFTILEAII